MNVNFCEVSENDDNIQKYLDGFRSILEKGDYIKGNYVSMFEKNFSKYIGKKYCVGVGNGTDALEIAIDSLDLPENTEIIVQNNSCVATALALINQRKTYKLTLCDVYKKTYQIDIQKLQEIISNSSSNNKKVLIITHLYGFVSDMDLILEICEKNNIVLIEDCAQSHGAMWKNKKVGCFGLLSCFSFYPTKNLGAFGDGGAILTDDFSLYQYILKRGNMGSIEKNNYEILGRNSRLDNLQAFVLDAKLNTLDKQNELRRQIASLYNFKLKNNKNIILPKYNLLSNPVYHLYVIRVSRRNELQEFLKKNGIQTIIHYPISICDTKAFSNYFNSIELSNLRENLKNSIELSNNILSLPMYPNLINSLDKIEYVCNKIHEFYLNYENRKLLTYSIKNKIGDLHVLNNISTIINPIERLFYIDGFENSQNLPVIRGNHAHKYTNQYLIIQDGSIRLVLKNRSNEIVLDKILTKNDTYLINKNTWITYEILEKDTKILVLCDTEFNKDWVIENYSDFLNNTN